MPDTAPSWTSAPGVALMGADAPPRVVEWARAAEAAGLGSVWIIEDYFQPGAYVLAAAAAAVTARITIGLGVVNPFTRHPAVLAMETGALAGIAPGRVVLGLGTSNRVWVEERMGIPFRAPLATLRETVDVLRRLTRGERVTHAGPGFILDHVGLDFPPGPPPPLLLGVKGPRALALAGEIADGVVTSILSSPAHVRRVRATVGRPRAGFTVAAYVLTALGDDRARARALLRPFAARYLGFLHGQSILRDAGVDPAVSAAIREAARAGRPAAPLVGDDVLERCCLPGPAGDVRGTLAAWAQAGLDVPVAVIPPGADMLEQIARIGAELGPLWKEATCR